MSTAFEPLKIGNLEIKTRIVRAPFQSSDNGEGGFVLPHKLELYKKYVNNEIGLIMTGQTAVMPGIQVSDTMDMIYYNYHVEEEKKLATAIHEEGGVVFMQLNYPGGKSGPGLRGVGALGPSAGNVVAPGNMPTKEATVEDIKAIVAAFALSAKRAAEAGFDGVLVHAAHSYIISEFLNPFYNKRTDEYGGSKENRFRLLGEIIKAIREEAGEKLNIAVKFECNAAVNDEEWAEDVAYFANAAADLGVCMAEFSGCDYIPRGLKQERRYYIDRVAELKKKIKIPVSVEGGIRSLSDIQAAIDAGIDMVGIGRPLICEPDLITKLKAGQPESICKNCSQCFGTFMKAGKYCIQHEKSYC